MLLGEHTLSELPSLSFSRYRRLKRCLLSGARSVMQNGFRQRAAPRLRFQVMGDIFHEVMSFMNAAGRETLTPPEFRLRFNAVVSRAYGEILAAPSSRHLGDPSRWPELVGMYRRIAAQVDSQVRQRAGTYKEVFAEKELQSRDGLLWGRLDAYFVTQDGIDLVDYKSGTLQEGTPVALEAEEQLHFYSYLISQAYGSYPRTMSLIRADGGELAVNPSAARAEEVAADTRHTLLRYNSVLRSARSSEELASPSVEACRYCDRKTICASFWNNLQDIELSAWDHVAEGVQTGALVRSPNGAGRIELIPLRSSLFTRSITVTRLRAARFPHVDLEGRVGQKLILTSLHELRAGNPAIVEATERTIILAREG